MIKVIHVISDSNIGGAGTLLLNYLRNFDRSRFDIKVAIPKNGDLVPRVKALGYDVIETEYGRDKSHESKATKEFIRIFRDENPDIVHTHSSLSAKIAAYKCGVPVRIYTRHCAYDPPKYLTVFPGRQLCGLVNNKLSTAIVAVADAAKQNLVDTGVDPARIRVIINGVDPLPELSASEKLSVRAEYGFGASDFIVGISARLEEYKGHRYFLDAAAKALKKEPALKFLIMGAGSCENALKEQAKALSISKSVVFTGFVSDVAPLVNIMDLNVNCSFGTETSSLALSEGMNLCKPAVATIYGGNPYMVADGENGLLVPIKDSDALCAAVLRICSDKDLYVKMSAAALDRYKTRFTAAAMTRQLEELYQEEYKKRVLLT